MQEALNSMDSMGSELLTLRHFEMLTAEEIARVLGIGGEKSAHSLAEA